MLICKYIDQEDPGTLFSIALMRRRGEGEGRGKGGGEGVREGMKITLYS